MENQRKNNKENTNGTVALNAADQQMLEHIKMTGYAEFELPTDYKRKAREWAKQGLLEKHKCSITKATYYGYGHNAEPFEGRCCNWANSNMVIPARMKLFSLNQANKD